MFYHDWNFEAKEMRNLTSLFGCLLVAAMGTCPVISYAQSEPASKEETALAAHDGYRVAQTAGGFQLVEHGVWSRPAVASAMDASARPQHGLSKARSGSKAAAPPSGFRRAGYLPHIYAAEAKYALPICLLDALVWTESRYNPLAVSRAGAAGLGQLMPGTAKDLGIGNRFDPLLNIDGAARYLRQMMDKFGVVHLALAAYNAGPRAVERSGGIPNNGETPAYVRNVLRSWQF